MQFAARMFCDPGDVAQLVEHLVCNQGVGGSSPLVSTKPTTWTNAIADGAVHEPPPPQSEQKDSERGKRPNQHDQAGETTSMPFSIATEQSRASYATRMVRSAFSDNALAR